MCVAIAAELIPSKVPVMNKRFSISTPRTDPMPEVVSAVSSSIGTTESRATNVLSVWAAACADPNPTDTHASSATEIARVIAFPLSSCFATALEREVTEAQWALAVIPTNLSEWLDYTGAVNAALDKRAQPNFYSKGDFVCCDLLGKCGTQHDTGHRNSRKFGAIIRRCKPVARFSAGPRLLG